MTHILTTILTILLTCATPDATDVARVLYSEARGESVAGQVAVAYVIKNRVDSRVSWWGTDYATVTEAPWQFHKAAPDMVTPELCAVAEAVLSGEVVDPTHGATHFHALGVVVVWGLRRVATIENHIFLR